MRFNWDEESTPFARKFPRNLFTFDEEEARGLAFYDKSYFVV